MDGTKLITDTIDRTAVRVIGRRSARVEVPLRIGMHLAEMRILVVVGSKQSENLCH